MKKFSASSKLKNVRKGAKADKAQEDIAKEKRNDYGESSQDHPVAKSKINKDKKSKQTEIIIIEDSSEESWKEREENEKCKQGNLHTEQFAEKSNMQKKEEKGHDKKDITCEEDKIIIEESLEDLKLKKKKEKKQRRKAMKEAALRGFPSASSPRQNQKDGFLGFPPNIDSDIKLKQEYLKQIVKNMEKKLSIEVKKIEVSKATNISNKEMEDFDENYEEIEKPKPKRKGRRGRKSKGSKEAQKLKPEPSAKTKGSKNKNKDDKEVDPQFNNCKVFIPKLPVPRNKKVWICKEKIDTLEVKELKSLTSVKKCASVKKSKNKQRNAEEPIETSVKIKDIIDKKIEEKPEVEATTIPTETKRKGRRGRKPKIHKEQIKYGKPIFLEASSKDVEGKEGIDLFKSIQAIVPRMRLYPAESFDVDGEVLMIEDAVPAQFLDADQINETDFTEGHYVFLGEIFNSSTYPAETTIPKTLKEAFEILERNKFTRVMEPVIFDRSAEQPPKKETKNSITKTNKKGNAKKDKKAEFDTNQPTTSGVRTRSSGKPRLSGRPVVSVMLPISSSDED